MSNYLCLRSLLLLDLLDLRFLWSLSLLFPPRLLLLVSSSESDAELDCDDVSETSDSEEDCEDEFTEVGQDDLEEWMIKGHFRCILLTLPYSDLVLRGCHQVLSRVHNQERDND